jgi:hypothetical protein
MVIIVYSKLAMKKRDLSKMMTEDIILDSELVEKVDKKYSSKGRKLKTTKKKAIEIVCKMPEEED